MIGLGLFVSSLGRGIAAAATPFDDTKTLNVKNQLDLGKYVFTGVYAKNPISGNILHTFHSGAEHTFDVNKKVQAKKSTDGGATHSAAFDIANPIEGGVQDVNGGYDSNGRFHLFYDVHESFNEGVNHWLKYAYSDDDGATWSTHVSLSLPDADLRSFRTMGRMIENNGVLIKPYYKFTDEGTYTSTDETARYILRSTDYGATWSSVQLERTLEWINEGSVIAADSTTLIYASRRETGTRGYRLYKSTDNGLTWTSQGDTTFGETFNSSHPPHLDKFVLDGNNVLVFYYVNRDTKEFKAVYGKPADVAAGVSGWNANTKIVFMDFDNYPAVTGGAAAKATSGYGMVAHIDGDLFAKGMQYTDYGQTVPTNILYYDLPTTHYDNIKLHLGI